MHSKHAKKMGRVTIADYPNGVTMMLVMVISQVIKEKENLLVWFILNLAFYQR